MCILSSHQAPSSPEEAALLQEPPLDLGAVRDALAGITPSSSTCAGSASPSTTARR